MNKDYKRLGKFIAFLFTTLIILVVINNKERIPIYKNNAKEDLLSDFGLLEYLEEEYYEEEEEEEGAGYWNVPGYGKSYNAMRDDRLKELDKHVH